MLQEFLLFLTALSAGAVLRALYFGAATLAKHTRLSVMRYVLDVLWCGVAALTYAAFTVFLCGGVFLPFTLLGFFAGLGLGSLMIGAAARGYTAKRADKEKIPDEKLTPKH